MTSAPDAARRTPPYPAVRDLWLQHSGWDRRGHDRLRDDAAEVALAAPGTRVCDVAPLHVRLRDDRRALAWRRPEPGDGGPEALTLWLGGPEGSRRLVRVHRTPGDPEDGWTPWREATAALTTADAEAMSVGLGVGRWHRLHGYCSRCGTATALASAGWLRRCPSCDAEHYPRTDPVVIMAVLDADDRICLSRGHHWASAVGMSCPAGFVDAAESLEDAVRREVAEELGLTVTEVSYAGSQPWPAAAQLMVAMVAHVADPGLAIDPDEVVAARWFTRAELDGALAAGEVTLPASYAAGRWLIEGWLGHRVPDDYATIYSRAPY
ncbi:MAG: NAD(+) diphosphatase [Actinobacteria bacterium]|nr:NAD(+) diphosphatase [Actinomycetota bacterium]